jgi:hypothetical protein
MHARKKLTHLGLSVAALTSALPAGAHAQDPTFGLGLFLGYNVQRQGLEWGFEGFATFRSTSESSDAARVGVGPLLQIGVLGAEDPRFTLALQGGSELARDLLALSGELGVSYRVGERGGFGVHVGVVPEMTLVNLAMRYEFLLNEAWFGIGTRVMPTYGMPAYLQSADSMEGWAVGRPLRAERGRVLTTAALHAADGDESEARARLLGDAWARDAQLEYASVPAFVQLAYELTALRAPRALVQRALDAVRDESQHAAGCAALASSHLRHTVSPTLPKYTPRPILACRAGLIRLAVESWVDGALVEGAAAQHAARAAELASPGPAQRLLRRIAVDERRHAELAWDILAWALTQAPEEARAALRSVSEHAPRRLTETDAPPDLERYGRVGAPELDRIAQRHAAESRGRLSLLLAA